MPQCLRTPRNYLSFWHHRVRCLRQSKKALSECETQTTGKRCVFASENIPKAFCASFNRILSRCWIRLANRLITGIPDWSLVCLPRGLYSFVIRSHPHSHPAPIPSSPFTY